MGHYYSEMVSDKERARKADAKRKTMEKRAAKIKEAIEDRGLEMVLAEIIDDPTMASIRFG